MTVFDLCCDRCAAPLVGPAVAEEAGPYGVGFTYHPGDPERRDDSGLLCAGCWSALRQWLGDGRGTGHCALCRAELEPARSLHVRRTGELLAWQLCADHAVAFLNSLRTVEPKLDPATFRLAADWPA